MVRRLVTCLGLVSVAAVLAACSTGSTTSFRKSDTATVNGHFVKWADTSNIAGKRSDGLSTLIFLIVPTQDGGAIPSIEQRQELAKAALASGSRCSWAGFDSALNQRLTLGNGGADYSLYALARCR